MNHKTKKITALYLVLWMAIGGVCGFLLTSDLIPRPDHLTFNPRLVYDYDIIFGVVGIACILLTTGSLIGLVRLPVKPGNEPHLPEEEPTARELAVGTLLKISAFNLSSRSAQRELFDKLDEAERFIVYRSAYSSFKAVNWLIIGGILFFILYSLLLEFTPMPISSWPSSLLSSMPYTIAK
ncbi:MAG: hypothetical protein K0Q59_3751 [Paenibacillus sp.]|jgi:hypothetical protein|nr:hypothetical protein [Paenibacillus sp.]